MLEKLKLEPDKVDLEINTMNTNMTNMNTSNKIYIEGQTTEKIYIPYISQLVGIIKQNEETERQKSTEDLDMVRRLTVNCETLRIIM